MQARMQKTHCSQFELSTQQRTELEEIIRKRNSTQGLVLRARIILAAAQGQSFLGSAKHLNCHRETVTLWRKHWVERSDDLSVSRKLFALINVVRKIWYKALRRRSQRNRLNCNKFSKFLKMVLPKVKILHPWPEQRFDARYSR